VENVNVSAFQGFRPQRRQIRATVAKLTPSRSASSRTDQCVTPSPAGGGSSVAAMTACSSCTAGRPERGRSSSAANPPVAYRTRQECTVGRLTPTRRPTSTLLAPSAASNTIRARCANPAEIVEDRVHAHSLCSSPARNNNGSTRDMQHRLNHKQQNHIRHATPVGGTRRNGWLPVVVRAVGAVAVGGAVPALVVPAATPPATPPCTSWTPPSLQSSAHSAPNDSRTDAAAMTATVVVSYADGSS